MSVQDRCFAKEEFQHGLPFEADLPLLEINLQPRELGVVGNPLDPDLARRQIDMLSFHFLRVIAMVVAKGQTKVVHAQGFAVPRTQVSLGAVIFVIYFR